MLRYTGIFDLPHRQQIKEIDGGKIEAYMAIFIKELDLPITYKEQQPVTWVIDVYYRECSMETPWFGWYF